MRTLTLFGVATLLACGSSSTDEQSDGGRGAEASVVPMDGSVAADAGDAGPRADGGPTSPDGGDAGGPSGPRFAVSMDDLELVGPFPSWANAKTTYGAAGDGSTDDTAALQSALNDLGQAGKASVLYIPAGNYKITSSLTFGGAPGGTGGVPQSVRIVGQDPSTTTITWAGPTGQPMFIESAGYASSFGRITWDGQKTAGFGIVHWWNTTTKGSFYDGSTVDEDEVFENMSIGIMAGRLGSNYGQLNSEGVIRRVTFRANTYAGFDTGSFNALDWWIYDSQFINCARGVSNDFSFNDNTTTTFATTGPAITNGAGAMYVYRSYFQASTEADFSIGNTGWFSMHQNVSINSRRFFESGGEGSNAAPTIIEGNRIVNTTDPATISNGNQGPVLVFDNQIRSVSGTTAPVITVSTDWVPGRDVLSIGNAYTVANPIQDLDAGADRHVQIDDTTVAPSAIDDTPPTMPPTPSWLNRQVFEVSSSGSGASAAIQTAVNAAVAAAAGGAVNPVVHIPPGVYDIATTIVVPKLARIQIDGDSLSSALVWQGAAGGTIFELQGPSYATVRDLTLLGITPAASAVTVDTADQPGGRIFLEGNSAGPVTATNLLQTALSAEANPYVGDLSLTNVASAVFQSSGPLGPVTSATSNAIVSDSWYEGTASDIYRIASGNFTYLGGEIAPATHTPAIMPIVPAIALDGFAGHATFAGVDFNTSDVPASSSVPAGVGVYIGAETAQTNALFLGLNDLWNTGAASSPLTPFYFDRTSSGGTVGLYLSTAPQAGNGSTDTPNVGTVDANFVVTMLAQARSLGWDTSPYVAPAGATDVRIARIGSQNSAGFVFSGK